MSDPTHEAKLAENPINCVCFPAIDVNLQENKVTGPQPPLDERGPGTTGPIREVVVRLATRSPSLTIGYWPGRERYPKQNKKNGKPLRKCLKGG